MEKKLAWSGVITGNQPRIRLTRSFDERSHSYLGFVLAIDGVMGDEPSEFTIGIGKAAQSKHQFQAGDEVSGESVPAADPRIEPAEYYKTSKLKLLSRATNATPEPPPWLGVPPELPVYRERGHRRLDARTYEKGCRACIWACRMAVEMIIDQWNPGKRKCRSETFCYGPKSCPLYRAGPTRKVPGRRGMSWEEENWVDEEATAHRGPDG